MNLRYFLGLSAIIFPCIVSSTGEPDCDPSTEESCSAEKVLYDSFQLDPNASLLDYLNPEIFGNETLLEQIKQKLHNNELVVVYDAFVADFADYVWKDLDGDHVDWKLHEEFLDDGFSYSHHNVYDPATYTTVMNKTKDLFEHERAKKWMADLSGRDTGGHIQASASNYFEGDYSLPHTDDISGRTVAFVWHLSKNWYPEFGGALYWCGEPDGSHAYVPASYNTLHLFSVTRYTNHFVTVVSPLADEKRLTFNGWWTVSPENFPTEENVNSFPDLFPTYEDRLHLTSDQVREIDDMEDDALDSKTLDWYDTLKYENDNPERKESFVIDLHDRRNALWSDDAGDTADDQ